MYQHPLKFTMFIKTAAYPNTTSEKNVNTSDLLKWVKANVFEKSLTNTGGKRQFMSR